MTARSPWTSISLRRRTSKQARQLAQTEFHREVLKYCDLKETVLQYANKLLMNLDRPNQWAESNLVPIPKDGNLSQVNNHREISLSQIMLEVVNRMILGTLSIDK